MKAIWILIFGCFTLETLILPRAHAGTVGRANEIGWQLYKSQAQPNNNLFLSPLSIHQALSLTFEGSQGEARTSGEKFLQGSDGLSLDLQALQSQDVTVGTANAIWTNSLSKTVKPPQEPFRKVAKEKYQADIQSAPFKPLNKITATINEWVKGKTNSFIPKLLDPENLYGIDAVILNAVYFKGRWENEFASDLTMKNTFHAPDSNEQTEFMNQVSDFKYGKNESAELVELPYKGGKLSMIVILPAGELPALEKATDAAKIESWLKHMNNKQLHVQLPKFEVDWGAANLRSDLTKLGMPKGGDFTPLGISNFQIRAVMHRARVKVNETGTEAAAATGVLGGEGAAPKPAIDFIADRPFIFIIRDVKSGAWLFLGRFARPAVK